MQKVLILVGPTASGKSALAVKLAKRFKGEVVSADSRQVYKGLDIGTGKITKREMRGVRHHMLDVVSPKKIFSAGDYEKKARRVVADISKRGRLPIIIGGTGFYIDSLIGRISLPNVPPNKELRQRLSKKSAAQLFAMLKKIDPIRARHMDTPSERNNKVRIIRAIEIAKSKPKSRKMPTRLLFDALWIGVAPKDATLKKNIAIRLFARIREQGMVREAERLHKRGLSYTRMRELGLEYRSLARHLQGEISLEQMEKGLQSDIWRYARKQLGYWKSNKDIEWYDPKSKKIVPRIKWWLQK